MRERSRRFTLSVKNKKIHFDWINRLIKDNPNTIGEYILYKYADTIDEKDILLLNKSYRYLLSLFIMIKPSLAYQSEYWKVSCNEQLENFKFLATASKNESYANDINWELLVNQMLNMDVCIDRKSLKNTIPNVGTYILC